MGLFFCFAVLTINPCRPRQALFRCIELSHHHQPPRHGEFTRFEAVEIDATGHALPEFVAAIPPRLFDSCRLLAVERALFRDNECRI
jgi:hypothetical protein